MSQSNLALLREVTSGGAMFSAEMPVWLGKFGDDVWPFVEEGSPLFLGQSSSSIVWSDYIYGRGATFGCVLSKSKAKYVLCLTSDIVRDLKAAAFIYGSFPKLMKDSRRMKGAVLPVTVKGRIEELAKFFSFLILESKRSNGRVISALSEISLPLLRDTVAKYPKSRHLKRALKLISDPIVQINLAKPLRWKLLDVTKSLILPPDREHNSISTLSDDQFLFLLAHCKKSLSTFMRHAGILIYDVDCKRIASDVKNTEHFSFGLAVREYLSQSSQINRRNFAAQYGVNCETVRVMLSDAHLSAMMIVLLFTGMRSSDTKYLELGCLVQRHGYWFLDSKRVKGRPRDEPVCEGWLAIDLVRDAYGVLETICKNTGNSKLFSSATPGKSRIGRGFSGSAINTAFKRWIDKIDATGVFRNHSFSVHQCRETLVSQLAKQDVGLPFISMQLKHFHNRFKTMPSEVTAGYGMYRQQLIAAIINRTASAKEEALLELYGEEANFAGGGAAQHKMRIDAFFVGMGLYGADRELYIKKMAKRGVSHMPTSIGSCTKNFVEADSSHDPACYGDYQCDPGCSSHVITARSATALHARKEHALQKAQTEQSVEFKVIWMSLAEKLDKHIEKLIS